MKSFSADIDINADPDLVWAVLIDTANWPTFDPYCERIEGGAALGETVRAFSTLAPGRAFPVKVTTFDRPKQMAWTGGLPLGMLKNVRTHTISPYGTGSRFEVTEVVSGPMLGMIAGALPDLTEPFAAFCSGLKARVEAQIGGGTTPLMTVIPDRILRMTRRFEASAERVFDAWITPETAGKWLLTSPFDEGHAAELDARVGGKWTITARRAGTDLTAGGEYLEIDRPRRLIFTFAMLQFSPNSDRITVEIVPSGAGCILTLIQEGVDIADELRLASPGVEGGTEKGWSEMFDALAVTLG